MKPQAYFILFVISFVTINGYSQKVSSLQNRNSIHLELGGSGGYYSLIYERNIINHNSFKTSGQVGFSYFPGFWNDIWVPIGINEQFSFNAHHIELGIGSFALREKARDRMNDNSITGRFWTYGLSGRLGYRYQKPDGRFIWRIGFTPLLQRERPGLYYDPNAPFRRFTPWGGVSVGYAW